MNNCRTLAVAMIASTSVAACARHGGPQLRDNDIPRVSGQGMIHLDGGRFRMGTDSAETPALLAQYPGLPADLFLQETPAHDVALAPFDIDRTEVTVHDFEAFIAAHPEWSRTSIPQSLNNGKYLANWNGSTPLVSGRLPVTFVSWYAATAYCQWSGARLPTESEFEFAARAGRAGDVFPWGAAAPTSELVNWSGSEIGEPVPVASYPPNAYGLYDMAGNVWQYTADPWRDHYTDSLPSAIGAPATILAMDSAALALEQRRHVIRGGSFDAGALNMRVRYRDSHPANGAGPHVGFRCARSQSKPSSR